MVRTAPASFAIPDSLLVAIGKYRNAAAFIGLIGLVALATGWAMAPQQFFRSYLVGFFLWFGISAGSLGLLMVQYLTGGAWGFVIRRILEAGSRTLPFMAVLFIPILFGIPALYEWDDAGKVAHDKILQQKQAYLNAPFWIGRAVLYFAILSFLMYLLNKWSKQEDSEGGTKIALNLEKLSAPGVIAFVFLTTFLCTDWIMSLTAHWMSTIFGFMTVVGEGLSTFAFAICVLLVLSSVPPLSGVINARHRHDLGKLMFAFVMLWAYMNFSQLLIIWSGNLPEETIYYRIRMQHGWEVVGAILLFGHFFLPFFILLSQRIKRNPATLTMVASYIIGIRLVDVFWLIEPNFHPEGFYVHWLDFVAPIGIGGIFVALFLMELVKRPLLTVGSPDMQKALAHGQHSH